MVFTKINKLKGVNLLIVIIIFLIPFLISEKNDSLEPVFIEDSSVGYYQSTTCKISITEVLYKNYQNLENLTFNFVSYPELKCFGKVTGLDKLSSSYIVSIGVNGSLMIILQSMLWISILFLLSKDRNGYNQSFSYLTSFFISILFTFQHFAESKFYEISNIYYKKDLFLENYYLLTYFVTYLFLTVIIKDFFEKNNLNIFYLIPLMFLINGTYFGHNINFYLIIFSFFGFERLLKYGFNNFFNKSYVIFSILWFINTNEKASFFDGDKIRGLINSSHTSTSKIFWILVIFLCINGLVFLVDENQNTLNIIYLKNIFIFSTISIVSLGIVGTFSNVLNQVIFLIFGQTKKGMSNLDSIAGNTWRGFSPSAELIGEFYGIGIIIFFYSVIISKNKLTFKDYIFLPFCLYGILKSNNFAAIISTILICICLFIYTKNFKFSKRAFIGIIIILLISFSFLINTNSYEINSRSLLNEAILHSDLFQYEDNYKNSFIKKNYFIDEDYLTLLYADDNESRASTSLLLLTDLYTPSFNIPFVPNIIGLLSFTSVMINRVELWGIAIAKYDPTIFEFAFGNGPYQLSDYLFNHQVRLDFIGDKANSLFLPHSSIFDLLLFGGFSLIGLLIYFPVKKLIKKELKLNLQLLIFIFILLNFLKSDSLLYIQGFTIFTVLYYVVFIKLKKTEYE